MGHYGKHIIDPETGLCEICDKDAIREIHQGKQPKKQAYYSNHDDSLSYRPNDDEYPHERDRYRYETNDEQSLYPARTVRPRRVVYEKPVEEPIVVRRKIVRRTQPPPSPTELTARRPPRPTTFYYVDNEGQMVPQNETPPPEPRRRYIVKPRHTPPEPTFRIARRRIQPSSPQVETIYRRPRRIANSDTEILERRPRIKRENSYSPPLPTKLPEMYHIISLPSNDRRSHSSLESPTQRSYDSNTPPLREVYDDERAIRPPISYVEPEPTGGRRVYRKLPPGKELPPPNKSTTNGNFPKIVRKNDRNHPPPIIHRNNRIPDPMTNPSVHHMRSDDRY